MSCSITLTGRGTNCRNSLGGIKNVYITQWSDGMWQTAVDGATPGAVVTSPLVNFKTFNLLRNTGSFNTVVTASTENGTVFFEETLVTVFGGAKEATDNKEIVELCKDRVAIIVQDRNDQYWVMGLTHGALVTAGSVDSGTAPGDNNGFTLTFMSEELLPPQILTNGSANTTIAITSAPA